MLNIKTKSFKELTTQELYKLLQLRSEVFVVEQDCVYQDIDGKDHKALHILGFENETLVAYIRIFKAGDYFDNASIGRVVVAETKRDKQYGKLIMEASIRAIKDNFSTNKITISAQVYLKKFYSDLGFKAEGEEYLEDNIPHIKMIRV